MRARRVAAAAAVSLGLGMAVPIGATAAPIEDLDLVAWYQLDETSGSVVVDSSGNGRDAAVEGTQTWDQGPGFTFTGGSASSGNAIALPDDLIADLDEITISADVWVDPALAGNHFIYNLGNEATGGGTGSGYLFATAGYGSNPNFRGAISNQWWNAESSAAATGGLEKGVWHHVTLTLADGTMTLFEDGVEVARNEDVPAARTPAAIGAGSTDRNYIGRSAYQADASFRGAVRDFRIYDGAMDAEDVATLADQVHQDTLDSDAAWLATALGDTSAVTTDLDLPVAGPARSAISWSSSNPAVVSATGKVNRTTSDETVTLTATLTVGESTETVTITVIVPGTDEPDRDAVDAAAAALVVHNIDDVRSNITLPETAGDGVTVTWASADPSVVTTTGEVTRPATGTAAVEVELTATLTKGSSTATRTFTAVVPPMPAEQEYEGYAFSYFTSDSIEGEKIYFGASNGNDARNWITLNGGEPVFTSELGTTGLRDPFLIRSPEGDTIYMIATDLSIGSGIGWDAAQRQGSQYLEVWETTDMVNWSQQRHVKVAPDNAGNTWAPEAYWDESIGAYVVFWASKLYPEDDPNHTTGQHQRMMYTTTRDFHTFTPAEVWQDTGISRIDSTVIKEGDTYHRFTKDEGRGISGANSCLDIFEETSDSLRTPTFETTSDPEDEGWVLQDTCIGQGAGTGATEGPTVLKANAEDVNGEGYYLFVDEFGGRKYIPLFSEELGENADWTVPEQFNLPSVAPRHGTVLPVTAAEHEAMLEQYLAEPTGVEPLEVRTFLGEEAQLPSQVAVDFADGSTQNLAVTWDVTDPAYYETPGEYTFSGAVAGFDLTASITVVVLDYAAENIAPLETTSATASYTEPGYGIDRTRNGDRTDKGWSNWQGGTRPSPATLTYTFPASEIFGVSTWYYQDGTANSWPETAQYSYRTEQGEWVALPGLEDPQTLEVPAAGAPVEHELFDPVTATGLRMTLANGSNRYLTVSEVEIYRVVEDVEEPVLAMLTVEAPPETVSYEVGEDLDLSGLQVSATYSDGSTRAVASEELEVSGFDSSTPGAQEVTLTLSEGEATASASFTVTITEPATPEASFSDVPEENMFFAEIEWLASQGISTGWEMPDGSSEFRPLSPINRDAMAAFLYRMADVEDYTAPAVSPFVDVSTSNQFYTEIAWLYEEGISTGWSTAAGREFRPLSPIARDAMAAFLYRMAEEPQFTAPATSVFADVAESNQFYTEISWMHATGIATGWDGSGNDGRNLYRPLNNVNRDAMAAFLFRYAHQG